MAAELVSEERLVFSEMSFICKRLDRGEIFCLHTNYQPHYLPIVDEARQAFIELLGRSKEKQEFGQMGRRGVKFFSLSGVGSLVFRPLYRGGYIRFFLKKTFFSNPFFRLSQPRFRPIAELAILSKLHQAKLPVPFPVGAYIKTCAFGHFYQAMLIMLHIESSRNLLDLISMARGDVLQQKAFSHLCYRTGQLARRMLEQGVSHPDLHIGNVLYGSDGELSLIDFDKAREFQYPEKKLMQTRQLAKRWRRSAKKHHLENVATEPFERGLFGKHE